LEDIRDVGVLGSVGTELVVGAVAEVGPVQYKDSVSGK
jgi:hypothetical protein